MSDRISVDDKARYRINTGRDMDAETEARLNATLAISEEEIERKRIEYNLANATDRITAAEDTLAHAISMREENVREAVAAGLSYREIASMVGLSHQRVAQIVKG